jgi:NTP pyrophosphatase (non-canonical NTP hydrolase)
MELSYWRILVYNNLDKVAGLIHSTAVEKGFWPDKVDDIFITKQLMMIVSEAVEVMEAIRKDKGKQEVNEEVADILIRTLDLWAGLKENDYVDGSIQAALNNKMDYNKSRPERHGVRF